MPRTDAADFRIFGAAAAFPGDLAASWGACLVEPPAIGALRKHARSRLARLGGAHAARGGRPLARLARSAALHGARSMPWAASHDGSNRVCA